MLDLEPNPQSSAIQTNGYKRQRQRAANGRVLGYIGGGGCGGGSFPKSFLLNSLNLPCKAGGSDESLSQDEQG